jgi:lipopolysaccharide export system permease protein
VSKFDRYILSQLMALFGFFSLILVAVYWVNRAVRLFDQLISDGQSAWVFLEFTALSLPYNIRIVLPVAAFVATVYVTNRLSTESELAVMRATGFSPWRLARPVFAFGLLLGLLLALVTHYLEPMARARLSDRRGEITANITQRVLKEGRFVNPGDGVTMFIGRITAAGEIRDIFISDRREGEQPTTYTADRAALVRNAEGPKLVLFDGMAQTYSDSTRRLTVTRFADLTYDIAALIVPAEERRRPAEELTTGQLLSQMAENGRKKTGNRAPVVSEVHERFSRSLLPIAASLIGFAALVQGGFSRFGLTRQILFAVGLLALVQLLTNATAGSMQKDADLWPLAYLPGSAGFAMAAALLWVSTLARNVPSLAEEGAAA